MGAKRSGAIQRVRAKLASAFLIVDMGPISFYLGLKVERNLENKMLKLSKPAYINKILEKFHFDKANLVNMSINEEALLTSRIDGKSLFNKRGKYKGMTGSLMFSIVKTRPNIVFATSVASCFSKNLSQQYTKAVKTILRYLKRSKNYSITYGGKKTWSLIAILTWTGLAIKKAKSQPLNLYLCSMEAPWVGGQRSKQLLLCYLLRLNILLWLW